MGAAPGASRYTAVAVVLHWTIAAAILLNLFVGWWMHEAVEEPETAAAAIAAFQLHKSVGLAVLALSLLRLAWRLAHATPALPPMPDWQRLAARLTHWGLYFFMVAVPLSGWLYVSTQWDDDRPLNVPTLWFGLFEVPHLFGLDAMAAEARARLAEVFEEAHELLAWSMLGLAGLHVAAGLKHKLIDRDHVLASMRPGWGALIALLTVAAIVAAGAMPRSGSATGSAIGSAPGGWVVDPASEIAFSGAHAGTAFRGTFTRWTADIRWDAANPAASSVSAEIETASARDGVPLHEETLREGEWFDVVNHPQARFRATRIGADGAIEGTLTIKDRAIPVAGLKATLAEGVLTIAGRTEVTRRDANLGMESDPSAEYVSMAIGVDVNVVARAP